MQLLSKFCFPSNGPCALIEKCLYIPPHNLELSKAVFSWEDSSIFAQSQPLIVEYCSGNGQWITEMALRSPQYNWIAVEKDFDRARKIWRKIFRLKMNNLFVVFGEGLKFSRDYLPDSRVKEVYVNFPDPWPKRRHAKHRIIQKNFIDELDRVLMNEGTATIVTDDAAYSEQMIALFASWKSAWGSPRYITEWSEFGDSYFQSLWLSKQRTIRYHRFIKDRGRGI